MGLMPISLARRSILALGIAAGAVFLIAPAYAYDPAATSSINVDKAGIAIRGYDPVAYFTVGKPTMGEAKFSAKHDGATYHFATASNRDAFQKEPGKYAPQFGGFCAMGTVMERKFDGDPNFWKIVDGKLYLNVAEPVHNRWVTDIPGHIRQANQNWPKIKDKAPNAL